MKVNYLPTFEIPADLMTKCLCLVKHYKFMEVLGIFQNTRLGNFDAVAMLCNIKI